jgi:Dihydroorotase and related cyclic amidohydrolases
MAKHIRGDYDLFEVWGQEPLNRQLENSTMLDLIIKNGNIWTPSGPKRTDVGVLDGKIVGLGKLDMSAKEVIDADGLDVMPGAIDTQVHFREPGLEHKENLESGTRSAVMGGITGVFEMPNTKPGTTTVEAMEDKMARAAASSWCEYAFYVGAAGDNVEQLAILENLPGVCGVKVFMGSSTGSLLVSDDDTLARVLASGRRRVPIHAEDEARLIARNEHVLEGDASTHPVWRDTDTAILAIKQIVASGQSSPPSHLMCCISPHQTRLS